jgi:hypothetical protein
MKPIVLFLLSLFGHALLASGQFAVIKDPDGFTNVRASDSLKAKIVGRLHDGEVVVTTFSKNGWTKVFYDPEKSYGGRYFEGFMHEDRLQSIENLPHMRRSGIKLENGRLTLQNDSVSVQISTAPFRPKLHVMRKDDHGNVETIDGKFAWGSGDDVPAQQITGLSLTIRDQAVTIPASAWNDLYEPTLETTNVYFDNRTACLYIEMPANGGNSASGAYAIAWVFKNGKYVTRYFNGF